MVNTGKGIFDDIWESIIDAIKEAIKMFDVPLKIAIVGFGNSGKSTLFNTLFGENLQETGAKTNLTMEDRSETRFGAVFTDTRGFGTGIASIDKIKKVLIDQNLIIHCLNGTSAISKDDKSLYDFNASVQKPLIITVTKADIMKEREIDEYKESVKVEIHPDISPIFISAERGDNMDLLTDRILSLLPEAAKDAFAAEQVTDLNIKTSRSRKIIHSVAVAAAAVAISPIPVSDVAILIPMQAGMVAKIGKIFGYDLSKYQAKEIMVVAGGGIVLRYAFQVLVKLVPVVGSIIGPVIAYGGTVAIGEASLAYFKSGMTITPEDLGEVFKKAKEQAKSEFKLKKYDDKLNAVKDDINKLKEDLENGKITQEEFEKCMKDLLGD